MARGRPGCKFAVEPKPSETAVILPPKDRARPGRAARPRPPLRTLLLPPLLAIVVALALLLVATRLFAHDIPSRVTVLAYV